MRDLRPLLSLVTLDRVEQIDVAGEIGRLSRTEPVSPLTGVRPKVRLGRPFGDFEPGALKEFITLDIGGVTGSPLLYPFPGFATCGARSTMLGRPGGAILLPL